MRTRTRVATGLLVGSSLFLATIVPAAAATARGETDSWAMEMTVPNHTWQYTVPICEEIPVGIETDGWGADTFTIEASVRHAKSSTPTQTLTYTGISDEPQVTEDDGDVVDDYSWESDLEMCPSDAPGTYIVQGTGYYGTSEDYSNGAPGKASAPMSTTFTLSQMSSTTSLSVKSDGKTDVVSGRVLGNSPTKGQLAVQSGKVTLQSYVNGSWRNVGTVSTNPSGYFSKKVPAASPKVPYRAVFTGTQKVAKSTSKTTTAQPTVTVKPVSNHSRLSVDVDPNKGSGSWTFQVQKQVGGKWVNQKSYKTQGSKETRTVDLPKGLYRVKVKAKYGYGTAYSAPVNIVK